MKPFFFLALLFCTNVNAQLYTKAEVGINSLSTDTHDRVKAHYQTGFIVSAALGYRCQCGIRYEAEAAYRRNELENVKFFGNTFNLDGSFQSAGFMANCLWDSPCCYYNLRPYIGAGIGYDVQKVRGRSVDLSLNEYKRGFAWQTMVGVRYCSAFSLEYKFHQGGLYHIYNHSFAVGLTYDY